MVSTNGQSPRKVVLYARVSTEEQARSGYSLAQQLEALRAYAASEGYEVVEEVADAGQSGAARGSDAALRIVAPMPGKVIRVLVAAGDAVSVRQPLVVVEAMKMENELRADRDGHVAAIHVQEGASVDAGTLLIELKQGR